MEKKKALDKYTIILIAIGVIIFGIITFFILGNTKKISVVVPKDTIEAGWTVTEDMLKEIKISADQPGNFIRNKNTVIGLKAKNNLSEDQLLYESDFINSWGDFTEYSTIPDDYIITSIIVPDKRACGGIITSGDYIDVYMVDIGENKISYDEERQDPFLFMNSTGTKVNAILSNVLVLTTNSALASSQESDLAVVSEQDKAGSIYVIALSYNDYMKLLMFENNAELEMWVNICPNQNNVDGNSPLIYQMTSRNFAYLHDSTLQVMDKDGNMLTDSYFSFEEILEDEDGESTEVVRDLFSKDNAEDEATSEDSDAEETTETTETTEETKEDTSGTK